MNAEAVALDPADLIARNNALDSIMRTGKEAQHAGSAGSTQVSAPIRAVAVLALSARHGRDVETGPEDCDGGARR